AAGAVVPEVVGQRLAPRVVREEVEPVPEALLEGGLQRVVVAAAARRRGADVRDQRVELVERPALIERRPGRRVTLAGQRLVPLDRRDEVLRRVADVP